MKCPKCHRDITDDRATCVYCGTSIGTEAVATELPSNDAEWIDTQAEMSLERALTLLAGIRDSFNNSQIKSAEYDKLVLDILKDYISPMDDKTKINFAADGIRDSVLHEYINENIHNDLKSYVIEYMANK